MLNVIRKKSATLMWALVLLHDILGIGPFLPRTTANLRHDFGTRVADAIAGPHWYVAALHLSIATGILLYLVRPKLILVARGALLGSVAFFSLLSVAFLALMLDNTVYVTSSAFCFSLTIISWRAFLDTKVDVAVDEVLRAAAWILVDGGKNGNKNGRNQEG